MSGPVFERILDQALDCPRIAAAIDAVGAGPLREELRARVLDARDRIADVAAAEYGHYAGLRAAALLREGSSHDTDRTKEGLLPGLAVLVPSLGAVATGVFLLCGFGLRAFAARPHIGDGLVMAGVIAAAVTAGAALGDLAWRLVTGARGRSGCGGADPVERDPEVRRARETWELALLERGVLPFLLNQVDLERAHKG